VDSQKRLNAAAGLFATHIICAGNAVLLATLMPVFFPPPDDGRRRITGGAEKRIGVVHKQLVSAD
jgi:hypothetical protein